MERITDAFVWPFRDPRWLAKITIIGLILLIPIVGSINGLGWMLESLDRLRAGDQRLPPANFDYLGKGLGLFVVNLVYVLALLIVGGALYFAGFLLLFSQDQNANPVVVALGFAVLFMTVGLASAGSLAFTFATPAIVLAVSRGGVGAGLRVDELAKTIARSPLNTVIAGLMLIATGVIQGLGIWVCLVGIVFTTAYALATQAWIVRSYEIGSSPTT